MIEDAEESFDGNICISEQGIVINSQVFAIESEEQFQTFRSEINSQDQGEKRLSRSQTLPQSDMIFALVEKCNESQVLEVQRSFVFENDPCRRNRSLIGSRHLRFLKAAHVVS